MKKTLYYRYTGESSRDFTKGHIYMIVNEYKLNAPFNFITNSGNKNGFGNKNKYFFIAATLDDYLFQNEKLEEIKIKEKAIEEKIKKISKGIAKGFSLHEQRKKQREIKKVPTTLFGMQIKHSPKAHEFSVAMAMVGLNTDIPSADLILRLFDVIEDMGDKFDLSTAVDLKIEVTNEYETIKEEFEKLTNKNK
jgi:hypothetical protein